MPNVPSLYDPKMNIMKRNLNYDTMSDSQKKSAMTLVLVGCQGSGKSATGNTILKRNCFECGMGTIATTLSVKQAEMAHGVNNLGIVDTPPLSSKETITAIHRDLSKHQQTTAVYAIVIAVGRFTQDERKVIDGVLSNSFMRGRTIFIFTRKNELDGLDCRNEDRLEVWLDSSPTIRRWCRQYKINNYFAVENTSNTYDGISELIDVAVNMNNNIKENCLEKKIFRGGVSVAAAISVILIFAVVTLALVILYTVCRSHQT